MFNSECIEPRIAKLNERHFVVNVAGRTLGGLDHVIAITLTKVLEPRKFQGNVVSIQIKVSVLGVGISRRESGLTIKPKMIFWNHSRT
jgi:hypothetical protein